MDNVYHFKPFLRKNIHKKNWFDINIRGGFVGGIVTDKYFYMFFLIILGWWLILRKFAVPLDYNIADLFITDKSYIYFYSNLMSLSGYLLTFLFSTYIGIFINVYINNFSSFSSALNDKNNMREYLLSALKWTKIEEAKNDYDKKEALFGVLSDVILYNTSEAYKLHYFVDGGIQPSKMAITQYMADDINRDLKIAKNINGDVPEETKLNVIRSKEMRQYRWLAENGYLESSSVDRIAGYFDSISKTATLLKRSFRTNMPPMITQPITFGFYTMYTVLIPLVWLSYGFYIGTALFLFIFTIYTGISSGIRRMKNIFEDPDLNPTIHGNTIGWECHNFAKVAFNSFEICLDRIGLTLNLYSENPLISTEDGRSIISTKSI
jgi:hypothetical protein